MIGGKRRRRSEEEEEEEVKNLDVEEQVNGLFVFSKLVYVVLY